MRAFILASAVLMQKLFFLVLTLDALQGKIVALCFKKEAAIDQIEKKWG